MWDPKDVPNEFYLTTSFADELVSYLGSREDEEQLFFRYLPFTTPHWPLQALRELIEEYKKRYDEGPHVLRKKRLQKLIDIAIVKPDVDRDGGITHSAPNEISAR